MVEDKMDLLFTSLMLFALSIPCAAAITSIQVGNYKINPNSHGDTWDPTWADDDSLYAAGNDGLGFGLSGSKDNVNFNKINGTSPDELNGRRLESLNGYGAVGDAQGHPDGRNWKSSGTLCLNGILYLTVARHLYEDPNFGRRQSAINASIIKSIDKGISWTRDQTTNYSTPQFEGQDFSTPYFIHYGKNGAASTDNADLYVYAISNNGFWDNGDNYKLGRVLKSAIGNLTASDWQYYKGGDGLLTASWTNILTQATPIISDPAKCGETGATYIPSLNRYILVAWYYPIGNGHGSTVNRTSFAFWESPKPWGPWTKIKTIVNDPMGWYCPRVLAKFQTQNGSDVNAFIACAGNWKDNADYTDSRNNFYKFASIPITLSSMIITPPSDTMNLFTNGTLETGNDSGWLQKPVIFAGGNNSNYCIRTSSTIGGGFQNIFVSPSTTYTYTLDCRNNGVNLSVWMYVKDITNGGIVLVDTYVTETTWTKKTLTFTTPSNTGEIEIGVWGSDKGGGSGYGYADNFVLTKAKVTKALRAGASKRHTKVIPSWLNLQNTRNVKGAQIKIREK